MLSRKAPLGEHRANWSLPVGRPNSAPEYVHLANAGRAGRSVKMPGPNPPGKEVGSCPLKLTTPKRVVAIVGDDYGVVHALKLSVEAAGYRVAIWSPAAFLELASDENIACLLLDHHMPQTNGLAIAAHLRTKGSNIPIALMSGTASPAIREQAAELGIETVPEKPFHEDELLAFIAANLD